MKLKLNSSYLHHTHHGIHSKLHHFVPKKHMYQHISVYFTLMSFMVVWFSPTQPNVI